MTYEFLKEHAEHIGDEDLYDNGIYSGTERYFIYSNDLYMRLEPFNGFAYHGKTETSLLYEDIEHEIKTKNFSYFNFGKEIYKTLCQKYGVKPNDVWGGWEDDD